jgi:hypothetical protein
VADRATVAAERVAAVAVVAVVSGVVRAVVEPRGPIATAASGEEREYAGEEEKE